MINGRREENIRRIIDMENRISQCRRCKNILQCIRKPSLGKGELEPDIILVFEYNSQFSRDLVKVVELRDLLKSELNMPKIYHTFMVRCQAKACVVKNSTGCYADKRLLDKEHNCLLTGKQCEGIFIKPDVEQVLSCLLFLLEEIEILKPRLIILFGERVSEFVLKSYGFYEHIEIGKFYGIVGKAILTTVNEEDFGEKEASEICSLVQAHNYV